MCIFAHLSSLLPVLFSMCHMCPKVWGNIAIVYTKSACFAEFSLAGYHTVRSLAQFFFYPNIGVSRLLLIRKS